MLARALKASCSKLMEVVLESMVNHLEQASAFRRAYGCLIVFFAMSASKIAQIAPGSLQEPSKGVFFDSKSFQERSKRLSRGLPGTFSVDAAIRTPF